LKDGRELVPNATHVVSPGQHLYFYYEVYDPARAPSEASGAQSTQSIRLLSSVAFFRGRIRVFETPVVETTELNDSDRKAAVFRLDVPAASLRPGLYTCQVNIVDDVAGAFAFPRFQVFVRR
jgi:hypothetical protein